MSIKKEINVQGSVIHLEVGNEADFICITDMANAREGDGRAADVIKNWIRTRTTLEFLGTWEQMHNPDFKVVEFDHFRMQAGLPNFVLSPLQWVEKTNAIGIFSKAGRYGGTYAHVDIAMEFGSAISPVFKLFLIKEYQLLKKEVTDQQKLTWDLHRTLAKVNYRIHTDAIRANIIRPEVSSKQTSHHLCP